MEESDWNSPAKEDFDIESEISNSENKELIIKKAKAGWTFKNAESVRIGDLYLMVSSIIVIVGTCFKFLYLGILRDVRINTYFDYI